MSRVVRQIRKVFIGMLVVVLGIWVLAMLLLPTLATTGKPVGNIGARITCGRFLKLARTVASTNDSRFELSRVEANILQGLYCMPYNAHFMIRTNFEFANGSQE